MVQTLGSLPVLGQSTQGWLPGLESLAETDSTNLVRRTRRGAILQPVTLGRGPEVVGLNITTGCGLRCAYCSVRGNRDGGTSLTPNLLNLLEAEIDQRLTKPQAVFLCPGTDPFPDVLEVQDLSMRIIAYLAAEGIESWVMTRGILQDAILPGFIRHAARIRMTVGLCTLDTELARRLEPGAQEPAERIAQIRRLRNLGIETSVALEPLLPGVTDTRARVEPIFKALQTAGVRNVQVGYLLLRTSVQERLTQALGDALDTAALFKQFEMGPFLSSGSIAPARYLPKARRQRGYAAVIALASEYGLSVRLCPATNPDFTAPKPEHRETNLARLFQEYVTRSCGYRT